MPKQNNYQIIDEVDPTDITPEEKFDYNPYPDSNPKYEIQDETEDVSYGPIDLNQSKLKESRRGSFDDTGLSKSQTFEALVQKQKTLYIQKKYSFTSHHRPSLNGQEEVEDENLIKEAGQFTNSVKKQILFSCLLALGIGNMMVQNVASFLPSFCENNDWQISEDGTKVQETQISLILSVFAAAQIVFAPFNSIVKNRIGSKNTILIGFFLMCSTTFGLGSLAYIKDPLTFIIIGVILRFFQGAGDIFLQITCYTIICNIFSDQVNIYISYIEIVVGVGLGLGPVIGSLVYSSLKFEGTMYLFGGLNFLGLLCCVFLIPKELNVTVSEEEIAEFQAEKEEFLQDILEEDAQKIKTQITWWDLLSNRHCFFALLTCFQATFSIIFFEGFIPNTLISTGLGSEDYVGYVYAAQIATYLPMCIIIPHYCTFLPRKFQFVFATLGNGIAMFLLGPSEILGFPPTWKIMAAAFPILGFMQTFTFIPIIPEMLERLQVDFNVKDGSNEKLENSINDKVNDAYGFVYAFSTFISPLIGSSLLNVFAGSTEDEDDKEKINEQKAHGQRVLCDYLAFFNFGLGIVLFIFNCGIFVFSENRQFTRKHAELKSNFAADKQSNQVQIEVEDIDQTQKSIKSNLVGALTNIHKAFSDNQADQSKEVRSKSISEHVGKRVVAQDKALIIGRRRRDKDANELQALKEGLLLEQQSKRKASITLMRKNTSK